MRRLIALSVVAASANAAPGTAQPSLDALIATARRPTTEKNLREQVEAIRAIGGFSGQRDKAAAALVPLLSRPAPPHPRTAIDAKQLESLEDGYTLYLATSGAAINALAELRVASTAAPLVTAMYRMPELFTQARRALVAVGPPAKTALQQTLRGENAAVNALFAAEKLGQYCGDRGGEPCQPVSALEFYPAVVLGDFHDPAVVPDLLAVLKHPARPAYYLADEPSPATQYNAVFDSLRKLGAPEAAAPLRALWSNAKADPMTRGLAIAAYAFCARDDAGVAQLGKIAADNAVDDQVRIEAATAYARLARDAKDFALLERLAARYLDASAKKAKEAAARRKDAEGADNALATVRAAYEAERAKTLVMTSDRSKSADEIRAQTAVLKKAEATLKDEMRKHRQALAPFKVADDAAKAYVGFARLFQMHVARVEIATRCRQDAACFADSLRATPADVATRNAPYLEDLAAWNADDKLALSRAAIDRAMVELGKLGTAAAPYTSALLTAVTSDDREVRQAILIALPHVATLPCAACTQSLDAAIRVGDGKTTLLELTLEAQVLRNYFNWAGK